MMMKLSFITDEATQDFDEAIALALRHHLNGIELRSVNDTPIDRISPGVLADWRKKLDKAGLTVCNLSSSFYKCPVSEAPAELEKLERLCDAADILGCRTIRGFAFLADEGGAEITSEMIALFAGPIRLLRKRGKRLLLEADPSVNTTNHQTLAKLIHQLNSPQIGAIYDPGNDLYDPCRETPFPEGYYAIRPYLDHIHIKDGNFDANGLPFCVRVGDGLVDYPALLRQLVRDGYDGYLSLETHYRVNHTLTEEQMRIPQGQDFTEGGMAATEESLTSLRLLLARI